MWLAPQVLCHLSFCSGFALLFDVCISVIRNHDGSLLFYLFQFNGSTFFGTWRTCPIASHDKWYIINNNVI